MQRYEKLGAFYLGKHFDPETDQETDSLLLYDARDLVTHAVCVGMTGSGKTGLCVALLEEAALDGIPALVIDPKGDLGNLLLTFPELRATDFLPWVNPDDARRQGLSTADHAARQADLWRRGLADWDQDGDRIRRLRQAAEFAIFTPGSEAGLPLSILSSFAAPSAGLRQDRDLYRERVASTVTTLLTLLEVDADPLQSREHILLSTLLDASWKQGRNVDLGALIQAIQEPPVERVGRLDLESFYPAKERFELALRLNNLLAAPGFEAWMRGTPLELDRLLYTAAGKPRIAIVSIAHLSDAERMFVVSLLLQQTLSWMRGRPGTTSLRALLYMDEIFGYIPPVGEPPSKKPFLTLLKQARAYGLGLVLATQNPVDLDYKGLSNAGTWFIGRLQTERDKQRVLEGLEGAGGTGLDRQQVDRILSGLAKRVFLLHNVHDEAPSLFRTRWVMSYLRGPLTRDQIRTLMDPLKRSAPPAASRPSAAPPEARSARPSVPGRPVLPPGIRERFLPARSGGPAEGTYRPHLLGRGKVHFVERRTRRPLASETVALLAPFPTEGSPDWSRAAPLELADDDLRSRPAPGLSWETLPPAASRPASYRRWHKQFQEFLYRSRTLDLFTSPSLDATSEPGESERQFRIRLAELAREERDRQTEALRRRHAPKVRRLEERIHRARQRLERERQQASSQKLQAAISLGATLLSAFTGRRRLATSTLGRATTAVRGLGRSAREAADIDRAEENVARLIEDLETLNQELEAAIDAVEERLDGATAELEVRSIRPRRTDVEVLEVVLAWEPLPAPGKRAAP